VSNSFDPVDQIYALKILRGPDNFAHNDAIDTFICYLFIVLRLEET